MFMYSSNHLNMLNYDDDEDDDEEHMNAEEILERIGYNGWYQTPVFLFLIIVGMFMPSWHFMAENFVQHIDIDGFRCGIPELDDSNSSLSLAHFIPPKDPSASNYEPANCAMYSTPQSASWNASARGNATVWDWSFTTSLPRTTCQHGYIYTDQTVTTSTSMDWDIVCEDTYLSSLSMAIFRIGSMIGGQFIGVASDKYGRKKVFLLSFVFECVLGCLIAASPNLWVYVLIRILLGVAAGGVLHMDLVMLTEMFPCKYRHRYTTATGFTWSLGFGSLAVWAYYIREWRKLMIALSVPFIVAVPAMFYINESIPWLVARGRLDEAQHCVNDICRRQNQPTFDIKHGGRSLVDVTSRNAEQTAEKNGNVHKTSVKEHRKSLEKENMIETEESEPLMEIKDEKSGHKRAPNHRHKNEDSTKTYTHIHLFTEPVLRKLIFYSSILWFANAFTYYGLTLGSDGLPLDFYLAFFINSIVEIPGTLFAIIIMDKIGRKWPLFVCLVVCGLLIITLPFITNDSLILTVNFIAKMMISGTFMIMWVYLAEVFPTVARNLCLVGCMFLGEVGTVVAPYINGLRKYSNSPIMQSAPNFVYGGITVLFAFAVLPLYETRNRPLPETLENSENYEEYCRWYKVQQAEEKSRKAQNGAEEKVMTRFVDQQALGAELAAPVPP